MTTYPGLPGPIICDYLSREASRSRYAPGVEFQIGKIEMVANTGTYIDSPFHRYADGKDLAQLPLESLADLDAVVVRIPPGAGRPIGRSAFEDVEVRGKAVLVQTGWDAHWRTERYLSGHPFLSGDAAEYLVSQGVTLVGIDSLNIDDTEDLDPPGPFDPARRRGADRRAHVQSRQPSSAGFPLLCGAGQSRRLRHLAGASFWACPYRQTNVSGFPAVALRSTQVEIVAVPAIGMKLTNLRRLNGREWLWRSDQIPLAPPKPGASYVETADSGGWDECFPTVGACPDSRSAAGDTTASGPWRVVERSLGQLGLRDCRREPPSRARRKVPYSPTSFSARSPSTRTSRSCDCSYALRHTGATPFPWIWSAHPLLNVQPGSVLELPGVTQVKIAAVHGRDDLSENDVVSWPGAIGGDAGRFTFPESGGWAVKLFGDFGRRGADGSDRPPTGRAFGDGVSPDQVPQVGVWINCRGWAPPGRPPYYNLALEPCIGAPGSPRHRGSGLAYGADPAAGRGAQVVASACGCRTRTTDQSISAIAAIVSGALPSVRLLTSR